MSVAAGDSPAEGNLEAFLGDSRLNVTPVFKEGRFPNVVVTMGQGSGLFS